MRETDIVNGCLELLKYKRIFAWRNNTAGVFNQKREVYIFHGMKGASDILGILPDGRFLAIECKSEKGKLSEYQKIFIKNIQANNGVALVVNDLSILEKFLSSL